MELNLINCYGPCSKGEKFWNKVKEDNISRLNHLIIGGDLNYTMGVIEAWELKLD